MQANCLPKHAVGIHNSKMPLVLPGKCCIHKLQLHSTGNENGQGVHDHLDLQKLYTSQLYTPSKRYLPAVDLDLVPGKGVGVRAKQDFKTGDLIGALPPLCMVYGPRGSTPGNEVLAEAITEQQLTPEQLRWLQLLRAGHQGAEMQAEQPRLLALRQLLMHTEQQGGFTDAPSSPDHPNQLLAQAQATPAAHTSQQSGTSVGITLAPPHPAAGETAQPGENVALSEVASESLGVHAQRVQGVPDVQGGGVGAIPVRSLDRTDNRPQQGLHPVQSLSPLSPAIDHTITHLGSLTNGGQLSLHASVGVAEGPQGTNVVGQQGTDVGGVSMQGIIGPGGQVGSPMGSVVPKAWVLEALSCHTLGDSCEDVAVAQLRQQEPLQSYLGLWPEFALLNHSCNPNTVHLVVGGWLLLRAVRPIAEGAELTTCHIGAGRFQHVASRRSLLQTEFGFHCTCGRCTLEHHFFPTRRYTHSASLNAQAASEDYLVADALRSRRGFMQKLLDLVFGKGRFQTDAAKDPKLLMVINRLVLNHLEPELDEALSATTKLQEKRRSVLAQCLGSAAAVEQSLQEIDLEPALAALLRSSVFELYRLQVELHELLPNLVDRPDQVAALKRAVQAADAVARGTEAHIQLTVQLMQKARTCYGRDSVEAREAELVCAAAHHARYGKVDAGPLRAFVAVRQQLAMTSSLAQRMGVLAWDDQVNETQDQEGIATAS